MRARHFVGEFDVGGASVADSTRGSMEEAARAPLFWRAAAVVGSRFLHVVGEW